MSLGSIMTTISIAICTCNLTEAWQPYEGDMARSETFFDFACVPAGIKVSLLPIISLGPVKKYEPCSIGNICVEMI